MCLVAAHAEVAVDSRGAMRSIDPSIRRGEFELCSRWCGGHCLTGSQ